MQNSKPSTISAPLLLLALFSIISVSACTYADNPLSARVFEDDGICGKWLFVNDAHEQVELTIRKDSDGWYEFVDREPISGQSKMHESRGRFYPTITLSAKFLNAEYLLSADKGSNSQDLQKFTFLKYAVSKDGLSLWNIDEQQLKSDILAHKLKGDVQESDLGPTLSIHDSADNMLKYLNAPTTHFKPVGVGKLASNQ